MNEWALVALAPFIMVVLAVWIGFKASTDKRKATLSTVETAIQSGQTLTPETIAALGMPRRRDSNGDLKWGGILLAVGAAFAILGVAIYFTEGDPEALYMVPAVGSFPGLIGLVLIIFGLSGKKSADPEAPRT